MLYFLAHSYAKEIFFNAILTHLTVMYISDVYIQTMRHLQDNNV